MILLKDKLFEVHRTDYIDNVVVSMVTTVAMMVVMVVMMVTMVAMMVVMMVTTVVMVMVVMMKNAGAQNRSFPSLRCRPCR